MPCIRTRGFKSHSSHIMFFIQQYYKFSLLEKTNENSTFAWLAQSVERKTFNLVVVGSIPTSGTKIKLKLRVFSHLIIL